jgi:hypothetical protein
MHSDNSRVNFSFTFMVLTFLASILVFTFAKAHTSGAATMGWTCCTIVTIVAAKLQWEWRREWWFWLALFIGVGLQIPLVLFFPWNKPYLTGTGGLALSIPGFAITFGCIWFAEKMFSTPTSPE